MGNLLLSLAAIYRQEQPGAEPPTPHHSGGQRGSDKGFSLVEVLVSVALFAVLLTGILPLFVLAKLRMDEADDTNLAHLIMDDYYNQVRVMTWEQVGSADLQAGTQTTALFAGEWMFRRRVDEQLEYLVGDMTGENVDAWETENTTIPNGNIPSQYQSQRQRYTETFRFHVDARVFFNPIIDPFTKYVTLEVRYVPRFRRIKKTVSSTDRDRGLNVVRIKRVVVFNKTVTNPE